MKSQVTFPSRAREGHALLLVLVLTSVVLVLMASTLNRAQTDVTLNARNNQYQATLYAAEAATEEVVARITQDFRLGNLTWVSNGIYNGTYQGSVPRPAQDSYWSNFEFSDGLGHRDRNHVVCLYTTGWSPLHLRYEGLSGWTNHVYVTANARQLNTLYDIPVAVQQDVELDLIPLFQYAIFYNSLLEFTWCAPMTVNGRTHSNTNMYTGSAWQLTFNQLVDVTGTISSPSWGGHSSGDYSVTAKYNAMYSTNSASLTLPIGVLTNNADLNREIINMPPPGGDTNVAMAKQRYYNKAGVVLLVSNSTVSAIIRSPTDGSTSTINASYTSTNYSSVSNTFPFLTINNTNMYDAREYDTVKLSDIDVSKLNQWLFTNAVVNSKFPRSGNVYPSQTNAPNLMYVADNRTYGSGQLTAVRLKNATTIPTNLFNFAGTNLPSGFTLATPNPLYVWGNYNVPNGSSYYGSTNTTAAGSYPASLVSDALTILSEAWDDSKSKLTLANRNVVTSDKDVTVTAAILTGVVYSTGSSESAFSGGVHNLPRLLEDWDGSSVVLTLNTSIVNLFRSARATNQFRSPGDYYYAPTRKFSFDPNLLLYYKQPPGSPMANYVVRAKWSTPRPYTTNYAGF